MIGATLSKRYEILREVGRGGMGVVYLARDLVLEREVAIKILSQTAFDEEAGERFRREARVVAKLDHPGIVPIHDIGAHAGAAFFVMPYVAGQTLRDLLQDRALSVADIVEIGIQAAEALDYSHALGVVHRDIKPENILVSRDDQGVLRARIMDFGVAKASFENRDSLGGGLSGTITYLSPEQLSEEEVDGRADVYALGTVLYECLAARPPFNDRAPMIFYRIASEAPAPLHELRGDLPPGFDDIVMRCLEKSPDRRPQRGRDVSEALERLRSETTGEDAWNQTVPLPVAAGRVRASRRGAFIGRERELELLRTHLSAAVTGEAQLVFVAGDAGSGKTRLLEEFECVVRASRIRVLHGRFLERDQTLPYQGFCDALGEYFRSAQASALEARLGAEALIKDLGALFPALAEIDQIRATVPAFAAVAPGASQRFDDKTAVFEVLARALAFVADADPLVVFLEELHAADVSVEALHYLTRRLGLLPVLFVGTYRPGDVDRTHPLSRLIESSRGDWRFESVTLKPMTRAEHRRMLVLLLASPLLDGDLVEKLFEVTEANPYFTHEVVRALVDSGAIVRTPSGVWALEGGEGVPAGALPESVQQAIEVRIERLPEPTRDLLATASVLGATFEVRDLEAIAGDVEATLDWLVDAGFLEETDDQHGDRLRFASRIVRDVLYVGLSRRRRRLLHKAVALRLEQRSATRLERTLPQLVHHFAHADVPDKVVDYALRLARLSVDSFCPSDTIRAATTVLGTLAASDQDAPGLVAEAHKLRGLAHHQTGDTDAALREFEAAAKALERRGTARERAEVALLAAETAWQGRRVDAAAQWVETGFFLTTGDFPEVEQVRARLLGLGATLANLGGDYVRGADYLAEAERLRPVADVNDGGGLAASAFPVRARPPIHVPVPANVGLASLDPALISGEVGAETIPAIFETLTRQVEGARIIPWLAEEVEPGDGCRTFAFRLRDGLRFHDGRRLTARDVRYSFERLLASPESPCRGQLAPIRGAKRLLDGSEKALDGFKIVSPLEFRIELEQPVSFFPALLTDPAAVIVPEGLESFAGSWRDGVVGTGPFRVVRFEPGHRLELDANPDYWRQGFPKSDGLVFSFGIEPVDIRDAFCSGRFSIAWGLKPTDTQSLRQDPEYSGGFREVSRLSTEFIALNIHTGPFADEGLRRHLAEVLDGREIARRAGVKSSLPASGLIPPGLLGYEPWSRVGAAPERGGRAAVGESLTGLVAPLFLHAGYRAIKNELFALMREQGFRVTRAERPGPGWSAARVGAGTDMILDAWAADYPDPDSFAHGLLHSTQGWVGAFCGTPSLDGLIERGRTETDSIARHEIYREIEEEVARRVLLIPLFHGKTTRFARPEVEGFELNFSSPHVSYEKLWLRR